MSIGDWLRHWDERQQELAVGVDADLVRTNGKKFKIAWSLFGMSLLLFGFYRLVKPDGLFNAVLVWAACLSFIGFMVMIRWARIERAFLNKPSLKEQPKMWPGP